MFWLILQYIYAISSLLLFARIALALYIRTRIPNTALRKLRPVNENNSFQHTQQSRCLPSPHLRTETDPISETLCSLEYRMMENVQKPSNPEDKKSVHHTLCEVRINKGKNLKYQIYGHQRSQKPWERRILLS
jgi:hypothetical protein